MISFPLSGKASTYSDSFVGRKTASGDIYRHEAFSAALLPRANWFSISLGTRLKLTHGNYSVVVEVNDRGAGRVVHGVADATRVLDLSRAAMAILLNVKLSDLTESSGGVITLDRIEIVPSTTHLGPVQGSAR